MTELPPAGQATPEVPEFIPLPLDQLSINDIMDVELYIKMEGNFVKYREPGIPFDEEVKTRLTENNHTFVYYRAEDAQRLSPYLEKNLKFTINRPDASERQKAGVLYTTSVHLIRELITDPSTPEAIKGCQEVANYTVDYISSNPNALANIIALASKDYYTYTHSVNVMCYSIALAQKMKFPSGQPMVELAQSALFHDVGKSFIDWSITNKSGPLDPGEFAIMKLHPEFGYNALQKGGEVPDYTLYGVRHHHEKLNGKGYPLGLIAQQIDLGIRILTLADMYDALSTRRVYRDAYTSYQALQTIKASVGEEIDEKVFETFVKMLGDIIIPTRSEI